MYDLYLCFTELPCFQKGPQFTNQQLRTNHLRQLRQYNP